MSQHDKILSICLFGRNDDYTHDFLYRLGITVNFIAHSLTRIDRLDDVEVLVLDWKSEVPLSEVVELSEDAKRICNFHYVLPEDGEIEKGMPLGTTVNLSLKRAQGQYIASCGADVLFSFAAFRGLFDVFEGRSFIEHPEKNVYICGRYSIPYDVVDQRLSVNAWEQYIRVNSWQLEQSDCLAGSFLHGAAGVFICHRDIYRAAGGLYEGFKGFGWNDIELTVRMMSYVQTYDLRACGVHVYDLGHHPTIGKRVTMIKAAPDHLMFKELNPNGERWGEVDSEIVIQSSQYEGAEAGHTAVELAHVELTQRSDTELMVLKEFLAYIKGTSRWSVEITNQELALLYALSSVLASRPIQRLLEVGPTAGVATSFVGSVQKWLEVYCIDDWADIDDRTGPHRLGILMYQDPVNHRGPIRTLNGAAADKVNILKDTIDGTFQFDLSVLRDHVLSFRDHMDTVLDIVSNSTLTFLVAGTDDAFQHALEKVKGFANVKSAPQVRLIAIGEGVEGSFYIPNESSFKETMVTSFAERGGFYPVINFHSYIQNLPKDETYLLFGYGRLGKIIFPMMEENILGVIDPIRDQEMHDGVPFISLDDIGQYPDATILITPSNFNKVQLDKLAGYPNKMIGIKM